MRRVWHKFVFMYALHHVYRAAALSLTEKATPQHDAATTPIHNRNERVLMVKFFVR